MKPYETMYQCDCSYSPDTLTAWLHLTDRCNFRCSYCYLPHEQVDMSLNTGKKIIDATIRSASLHKYSKVFLKYAGGEPLLRFPLICKIHNYAQKQAELTGIEINGNILSNGTLLTLNILDDMLALDVSLVISIDGMGKCHDKQRYYADGKGSCVDVIKAVKLAVAHGVVPYLSIVITGQNAEDLPELISWALDHDLPFNLSLARTGSRFQSSNIDQKRIIRGMLSAYRIIEEKMPRYSLLASLLDNANLTAKHVYPCSAGKNYMAFNCMGNISKCQMEYGHPVTDITARDPLATLQNSTKSIQNVSVENKEECNLCEWKYWCVGGCPLSAFKSAGRYDAKSPNCAIYKRLYPEVFRLEELRLQKYASV